MRDKAEKKGEKADWWNRFTPIRGVKAQQNCVVSQRTEKRVIAGDFATGCGLQTAPAEILRQSKRKKMSHRQKTTKHQAQSMYNSNDNEISGKNVTYF